MSWDSRPVLSPSQRTLSRQIMRNWEVWKTNIEKSNNHRMIQQLDFHSQQIIEDTSVQDLEPRPCDDNDHVSVLPHDLNHIKCRTNDDRFPLPL